MGRGLFVTGTGTDVGKTFVTALMVKKLREHGYDGSYYKAALSGAETGKDGGLIPGDAQFVKMAAGLSEAAGDLVTYIYKEAVSPHLASRWNKDSIDLTRIQEDYARHLARHDYLTMEGSGGIICPLSWESEKRLLLEDVILALKLPCVIVADAGLGTINASVLTARYLKERGIRAKGFFFNHWLRAMKKHTDSQHIYHFRKEGIGCYGIMLKQRDYYIYAYLPDTEVFCNLPLSVIGVIFLYFLMFGIFWFWTYRTNLAHRKQEFEKDEKYKAELLTAAKKAEAANEAKTEFLHRMSHDIRTPINGIYGLINMADHYADDMEKQKEYRTKVKAASNLLLELVNDVLDMSKLESGEVVLEESPFNLSKISEEVLVVIEQIAAEQNIRIVWEKKEIIYRDLIGSPGYVKRVMMNILSNAVKYNRENGHIYLSCMEIPSEQPGMTTMEFICRDTGIGMTEEFQKHIFEPFAQEYTGSRTKFVGTGLGMAIARKLVEKMGGTITFESEKGVGTTFVIRVPFKIDPDADKREEQKEVSEKSIKGLHILLAEDNELNMEIAEFMLQNEGADVTKAWNGQEAVELFRKSEPGEFDVILMDIMMPVMNGYEAAKTIRSLNREDAKTIPIIAMTANAFTEDRIKAKEAGMDEHVAKPVDMELLIKVIHRLVK